MQRGGLGGGSLRASWRQRQAARAANEALLLQPTLTARPLLLQARLAPLFATYGSKLASEHGIWDDEDGEMVADQGGSDSSGKRSGGGNGSSNGGIGCEERGGGSRASLRAGDAEPGTDGERLTILQHIRGLEAADGWRGLNRAVLHGLLVGAWRAARAAGMLAVPADDFAPDAAWQLSTGAN